MLPVRCFTCNKVIGQFQDALDQYQAEYRRNHPHRFSNSPPNSTEGIDYTDFFERFRIQRICCRKIIISHIDIFQYNPILQSDNIECRSICHIPRILKAE